MSKQKDDQSELVPIVAEKKIGENLRKLEPRKYLNYVDMFKLKRTIVFGVIFMFLNHISITTRWWIIRYNNTDLQFLESILLFTILLMMAIGIAIAGCEFLMFLYTSNPAIKSKTRYLSAFLQLSIINILIVYDIYYGITIIGLNMIPIFINTSVDNSYLKTFDLIAGVFTQCLSISLQMVNLTKLLICSKNISSMSNDWKSFWQVVLYIKAAMGLSYFFALVLTSVTQLAVECIGNFTFVRIGFLVAIVLITSYVSYRLYKQSGIYIT